jgi:chloride channel 7
MATLFFNTQGNTIRYFFDEAHELTDTLAVVFLVTWFFMTSLTYGVALPSGLFFPGLLIGASLGEFVGRVLISFELLEKGSSEVTVYSVVGGAAVLAGYCRLSFCLAVLMMETTQNVNLFVPMLVAVAFSKGIGNMLNSSLYIQAINFKGIPMIPNRISKRA